MREVYLAGRGLASSLGPDLASGLVGLKGGGVSTIRVEFTPGLSWPFYTIAGGDTDWTVRASNIVRRVAEESGALAGQRDGPLWVASSSLDIGAREASGDFGGDYQSFAETVAAWLDWRGPVLTVATACTSGLNALLSAANLIRKGGAEHALVLGLELRNRVTLGGFGGMQLLSPTRALPLGAERDGLVLGEAVAALYLGSRQSRWRVAGGANVVNGQDPAGAVETAVVAMCRQALASSGLTPRDIALIKPQAAGSRAHDAIEVQALRQVFNPLPPLVSLKSSIGHTLGAAGVAEIVLLTACLEAGVWPGVTYAQDASLNAHLAERAPACARHVLASIIGFGGGHAAVVLEDGDAQRISA